MMITRHRPATKGIAERFVERLKGMLAEREWKGVKELVMVFEERLSRYTMMLRIKGWMVYLQMNMGGDSCVRHQVDYNKTIYL